MTNESHAVMSQRSGDPDRKRQGSLAVMRVSAFIDRKTAGPQDRKTARPQDRKT